ncbi:CdiA family toxin C-terminal domain-containing protein [Gilliamella sp.]|uniref:CdiA family toxin C-terminal domain-containing protein n=2 Tax=Gilliamella sp. TaxID=1891236 RepID=UPI0025E614B4|nr:CdiA family toxin C-terminal domain-containing protein [Gilliamella sp.]
MIKVENSGFEGIVGKEADAQLVPDTFVSDVTTHNKQIGILNKKKDGISGAHNQDAFLESVEMTGAKIVGPKYTDRRFPGLIEYQYQLPARAANGPNAGQIVGYKIKVTKTTYNPAILSDAKIASMSQRAAKQAERYFMFNPESFVHDVKIDGYWFRVTRDAKSGKISNSFITMPKRNVK